MSTRRMVGVVLVVLSVGVPVDMFACGDKFLIAGRGTRLQRPKNARAASVLIYAAPASAMAATIKKAQIEKRLTLDRHSFIKVQTLEDLLTTVSNGRFDVILTANDDSATVRSRLQAWPDASAVVGIDDLVKDHSAIDKAVLQRDQDLKKRDQNLKKTVKGF